MKRLDILAAAIKRQLEVHGYHLTETEAVDVAANVLMALDGARPEPTIANITAALAALAKALPDSPHITIGLHSSTDEAVDAFIAEGAKLESGTTPKGDESWRYATLYSPGVSITAYGPHRPVPKKIDADAGRAALAMAAEVLP